MSVKYSEEFKRDAVALVESGIAKVGPVSACGLPVKSTWRPVSVKAAVVSLVAVTPSVGGEVSAAGWLSRAVCRRYGSGRLRISVEVVSAPSTKTEVGGRHIV